MKVRYSYLPQQFAEIDDLLVEVGRVARAGDFTLGEAVQRFETAFAQLLGIEHAVGVGSGTDAIKLGLAAHGVGPGDEVITAANTFIATVGAIHELGARPVFVDCEDTFCMDVTQLERVITPRTKAIVPVHYTGYMADMQRVMQVAEKHDLVVVEDACQAILAERAGRLAGTVGHAGAFSLHPLKNLNVWGDGGVVVTASSTTAERLRLLRNHGMKNRDEVELLGYNSRLDTIHAVVGNWLIGDAAAITQRRIDRAQVYDAAFRGISELRVPVRRPEERCVFHLYVVFAERRDELLEHCLAAGIEAKVHYPIPVYRQKGLAMYGHRAGDFPVTDRHARCVITFPCDQHLGSAEQAHVIATVRGFYGAR